MPRTCPRCGAACPEGRLDLCPGCLLAGGADDGGGDGDGTLLGENLELLEEVGRGGMGTVYRARDRRLDREVAVKLLAPDLAADTVSARRFDREARALARLSHPGIVAIHDLGRAEDRSYLVMELAAGRPLSDLLPLAPARAVAIARQLCEALAYAHRHGVVHRDLKPQNILVDSEDRVKVADFGIARIVAPHGADGGITRADIVLGTPEYMAPEAREGAVPDPRMDLYSLGVVLYEMVKGERPAGSFPSLPGGLDRIARRAMAPDPAQRYASAEAMAADLARLSVASRPTPGPGLEPEERGWPRAVALLLTLATGAVLWALLVSITPRVLPADAARPLVMLATETLADGRLVSRARFEPGPAAIALAAVIASIAGYALLLRHWRDAGLFESRSERPIPPARWVLALGLGAVLLYVLRLTLQSRGHTWAPTYVPILGGTLEIAVLFCAWLVALEARRTARPLRREPTLWAGMLLALLPPLVQVAQYLRRWRP